MPILLYLLSLLIPLQATSPIPKDLFYLNEIALAQKQAQKKDVPLVFIIGLPANLEADEETSNPISPNPAGATHYAFQTFQERGILIWIDAELEQKKLPEIIEKALYDDGISFFYPPKIIISTPNLDRVIATVNMTEQIEERQRWSLSALEKMEDKETWKSPLTSNSEQISPLSSKEPPYKAPPFILFVLGFIFGGVAIYVLTARKQGM